MTGQQKRSADDLEDEFVFQDVGVSESENEEQQHEFQVDALDEEQEGFAVNNDEGNDSVLGPASSTSLSATKTKSQKKRQISKEKKVGLMWGSRFL